MQIYNTHIKWVLWTEVQRAEGVGLIRDIGISRLRTNGREKRAAEGSLTGCRDAGGGRGQGRRRVRVEDDDVGIPSLARGVAAHLLLDALVELVHLLLELGAVALVEDVRDQVAAQPVGLAIALHVAPLRRRDPGLWVEAVSWVESRVFLLLLRGQVVVVRFGGSVQSFPHLTDDTRDHTVVRFDRLLAELLTHRATEEDEGIARTGDV